MREQIVCTIITKSYLAYARTLADTLAEHNPNSKLFVLLADRVDGYFDTANEPFKLILLSELNSPETVEKMCFYYTPFELCCALRGMLHEYILENTSAPSWIFLDSDIMVCNSLEPIFQKLENTSVLLTPHITIPVDREYVVSHEINSLRAGLYNAGFLGIRRTDNSSKFIRWFKERLISFGFNDIYSKFRGLFVDQLWLNLAPLYFKEVELYLNPGANLGYWNFIERQLEINERHDFFVNNKPLIFVHFSGWDINNPAKVSTYAPMYDDGKVAGWAELANTYREKLLANGYEESRQFPYAFNYFDNGKWVEPAQRLMYYDDLMKDIACDGSPFANFSYFQAKAGKLLIRRIARRMMRNIVKILE